MKKIKINTNQAKFIKESLNSVNTNFSKAFKKEPSKSFRPHDDKGKKFNPLSENEEQTTETDEKFGKQMINVLKDIIQKGSEFELPKYFEKFNISKDGLLNLLKTHKVINDNLQVFKNNLVDNVKAFYIDLCKHHAKPNEKDLVKPLAEIDEASDETHTTKPTDPKYKPLDLVHFNKEIAIFKDDANKLFVFYYFDKDKDDFKDYAAINYRYSGKNSIDSEPEYDFEEWNIDGDVLTRYVNDNLNELSKGKGLGAYEQGKDLCLIDDALKAELIGLYNKDKNLVTVLGGVSESTTAASSGSFSAPLGTGSSDVIKRDIVDETTDSSSSGQYSQPAIWAKDPNNARFSHTPAIKGGKIVKVSENFIYNQISKKLNKSVDEVKKIIKEQNIPLNKLPKLFKLVENGQELKTQTTYKDGEMVSFDNCTKLNNNKKAEEGGCSVGAVDKVAKGTKTKDSLMENSKISPQQIVKIQRINSLPLQSVISTLDKLKVNPETLPFEYANSAWADKITYDPNNNRWLAVNDGEAQGALAFNAMDTTASLSEDKALQEVAKRTGKTLEEVKKIINKNK